MPAEEEPLLGVAEEPEACSRVSLAYSCHFVDSCGLEIPECCQEPLLLVAEDEMQARTRS